MKGLLRLSGAIDRLNQRIGNVIMWLTLAMVVVGAGGEVRRVEVLSFDEPPDYMPREGWYGQFEGQALSDELDLDRGIRRVTGATLTGRATTDAVRRVLALHRAIGEAGR